MVGSAAPDLIQEAILTLCGQLKDDAVSLVDAIAPPDFVLNSPIGLSDGQVSYYALNDKKMKYMCLKLPPIIIFYGCLVTQ